MTSAIYSDKILPSIEARIINSNSANKVCQRRCCERDVRRRGGAANRALGAGNNISATVAEMRGAILLDGYFIGSRLFYFENTAYSKDYEVVVMKNRVFEGAATAIITPFYPDGGIDFDSFGRLIDFQIESGIDAIVAAGTTGEGSTLTDEEHRAVIEFCVKRAAKRVPIIAGTGSNDIQYAKELTRAACELGADAMLLVTPYYNKATQAGLIKSFSEIADVSDKPCILYNVPSRTGCNILPETAAVLSHHPNIVGIKEASGNISQIAETARQTDDDFSIYSGNDDQIVPVMSLGGSGVISVLSNLLPKETSDMCKRCLKGDYKSAAKMQLDYLPLVSALFSEVNPIPAKAAMAAMGYGSNTLRLPLTSIEKTHAEVLYKEMKNYNIIFKEEAL